MSGSKVLYLVGLGVDLHPRLASHILAIVYMMLSFISVLSSLPIIHLSTLCYQLPATSYQATKLLLLTEQPTNTNRPTLTQTNNMSKFIANFMVLLVCTITFVSLPLWRSEKVQRRSKKGKGGPKKPLSDRK
jgi:hypothetical protein